MAEEQAQVDVGSEHEAVRAGDLHVLEAAVALVHAMLVAGEAHNAADRRHLVQDRAPVTVERRRGGADAQRHQLGLADAQRGGGVADAQGWLLALEAGPAASEIGVRG